MCRRTFKDISNQLIILAENRKDEKISTVDYLLNDSIYRYLNKLDRQELEAIYKDLILNIYKKEKHEPANNDKTELKYIENEILTMDDKDLIIRIRDKAIHYKDCL